MKANKHLYHLHIHSCGHAEIQPWPSTVDSRCQGVQHSVESHLRPGSQIGLQLGEVGR